ncbi:hypothetical protein H1R20_g7357, partial [Candolleomyces eurysporus]
MYQPTQPGPPAVDTRVASSGDVWIPVKGGLMTGIVEILRRPNRGSLIQGGEDGTPDSNRCAPLYVARAMYEEGCHPGECGLHLSEARIPIPQSTLQVSTSQFEALCGHEEAYQWYPVSGPFEASKVDGFVAVIGGYCYLQGIKTVLYVARGRLGGRTRIGSVATGACATCCRADGGACEIERYDVLVRANPAKVVLGTYFSNNDWTGNAKGAHYSTAVNFSPPLSNVPRVLVSLKMLDIVDKDDGDTTIRVEAYAQNITRDGFICNVRSWDNTCLYNARLDWIAIEEPGWQSGVLRSQDVRPWGQTWSFEHRIDFPKPFEDSSPPMVFVAFSSFDVAGKWNIRTHAANVDHAGFTMAVINCGEEEVRTKVWSSAITWIAVPLSDVVKKRNAWIGTFATSLGGPNLWTKHDGADGWVGHVNFGFEFKRVPKIFVGLREFSSKNDHNLRVEIRISNVTTTGMDWGIAKWSDTLLFHAGANFLAVDTGS